VTGQPHRLAPFDAPATPVALLARAAALAPEGIALVAGSLRLPWAAYAAAAAGLAAQLRGLGAGSGAVVALSLGNSAQMAIGCFAAWASGATLLPLNPDYSDAELAPLLAAAQPAVIACFAGGAARLREAAGSGFAGQLLLLPDDATEWLAALPATEALALPDPDAIGLLQFTGGTTGRPKSVRLAHQAIAINVAQREAALPTEWSDERVLVAMPLYHSFASAMGLLLCANCAGTLALLPRYRPDWVQDAVATQRITRLPAGPTLIASLLQWDGFRPGLWTGVRSLWLGSAPLPQATLERWVAATGVPVLEGWGQTEAGPVLTYQRPDRPAKPRSVGPPLPLTEIRAVDPATRAPLPAGATGELAARGPQLMAGYLDDPAATDAALVDGWLMTGDIGHVDADGDVFITDRAKDMAIISGFNVYPREVDEALATHPGVAAAAVVATPCAYRGERLVAFVVPVAGGALSAEALAAHAEARLVRYKLPGEWRIVDALPKTPVGKVDKAELRRRLAADAHSGTEANVA
jgi:long-chain acyl-CoA synthetase